MTLPDLPVQGEDPWFEKRSAFDEAVRDELEGRLSEDQLNATIGEVTRGKMFTGTKLITVGESTMVNPGYRLRVRDAFDFTHPDTEADPVLGYLQRAHGGWTVSEMARNLWGSSDPWPLDVQGVVLIKCLLNTARLYGAGYAAGLAETKANLRTIVNIFNAASIHHVLDIGTWGGTWTTVDSAGSRNGQHRSAGGVGATLTLTLPDKGASPYPFALMTRGRPQAVGPVVQIENLTTGEAIGAVDLSNTAVSTADSFLPIPIYAASGDQIKVTVMANTGTFSVDAVIVPSVTPAPVIMQQDGYLADYSTSTQFPNGSDAAIDDFNALLDEIATDFDNVFVSSPDGYWDKNAHLGPDKIHPNDAGNAAIAASINDAISRWVARGSLGLNVVGKSPVLWPASAAPFMYVADDFNRVSSPPLPTPVGEKPWVPYPSSDAAKYQTLSNQLVPAAGRTLPSSLVVDSGHGDGIVKATLKTASIREGGLVLRLAEDGSGGLLFTRDGTALYRMRRWDGSVWVSVSDGYGAPADNDVLSARMVGDTITCYVNGVELLTCVDTEFQANTRHGIGAHATTSSSNVDDFSVTAL